MRVRSFLPGSLDSFYSWLRSRRPRRLSTPRRLLPSLEGLEVRELLTVGPVSVFDATKGIPLLSSAPATEFAGWSGDLRAQAAGAVTGYSWNLSGAPDAVFATGTNGYRLQFTWDAFVGPARTETIQLTTTFAGGGSDLKTFAFRVLGTDSPAWSSASPLAGVSWPTVITPDQMVAEATADGPGYALGLASGSLNARHELPSYNTNVPGLNLAYNSVAASPKPIFLVRQALAAGVPVPARMVVTLTFNGVAGSPRTFDTSAYHAGDIVQYAVQADASSLPTGRYSYQISVTPEGGDPEDPNAAWYNGYDNLINESASPFGAGWSLTGMNRLWQVVGGTLVEASGGASEWWPNSLGGIGPDLGGEGGGGGSSGGGYGETALYQNGDGSWTRAQHNGTQAHFTPAGLQDVVVDRNDRMLIYTYDSASRVVGITDPYGQTTSLAYDINGKLASMTDPAGRVTSFSINAAGLLTAITDADGAAWAFSYNAAGLLSGRTDPNGHATTFSYDAAGRVSGVGLPDGSSRSLTAVQVQGLATPVLAAAASARFTDGLGQQTEAALDFLGKGQATVWVAPGGAASVRLIDGNGQGWLQADPLGRATRSFFNSLGDTVKTARADGSFTTATFDGFGSPLTATDGNGHTSSYAYDADGNLTVETDATGQATTRAYAAGGILTSVTNALGEATSYAYDSRGRVTAQTNALGKTTYFAYDSAGNKTSTTDPLGHATASTYDAFGRVVTSTDALGGVTAYDYDAAGNLVSVTDPSLNEWTYSYDTMDRRVGVTDPLGNSTVTAYNANNQVTQVTDRNGRVISYAYDAAGRRTSETWLNGSGGTVAQLAWTYDAAGQVLTAADPWSSYAYSYDAGGRLAGEDNAGTPGAPQVALNYAYDAEGNLTSVTDSLGGVASYGYDAADRLTSAALAVSGVAGATLSQTYDNAGRLAGQSRTVGGVGPSVDSAFNYDLAGQLTGLANSSSQAGALSAFGYAYDDAGRLAGSTGPEGALTFALDNTNQLTGVSGAVSESFSYDANGNRTGAGYQTGAGNRLLSDGTFNYTYDNSGNVVTKTRISDGEVTTNTYDHRNRLVGVQVKTAGGVLLREDSYTYDINGRRIGVLSNGERTWTAYRGRLNALADFNAAGALVARYLHGTQADSLVARQSAAGVVGWYLTDVVGSVRQIVTPSGGVLYAVNFTPFGRVISSTGTGDRFGFTGRELNATTGDYYYRARQYSAEAGRFLSEDPTAWEAGDANFYRYVGNSPGLLSDPLGLWSWRRFWIGVGVAATVVVAGAVIIGTGGLATPLVVGIGTVGVLGTGVVAGQYAENDGQAILIGAAGGLITYGAIIGWAWWTWRPTPPGGPGWGAGPVSFGPGNGTTFGIPKGGPVPPAP